jgi:catechol 2,3-dioxygenase-like lactoylglutathione lyase family enzyme
MSPPGILRKVDAVTILVPDIDAGVSFYVDVLGHRVNWRSRFDGAARELLISRSIHARRPTGLVDQ